MENELLENIGEIVESIYKNKSIKTIIDKGKWYKHIFKIIFDDDSCVYVKFKIEEGSNILMEKYATDLLNDNNIQQPRISLVDLSKNKIPFEYGIYENIEGTPLSYYLKNSSQDILKKIYFSLGEYFKKYADIRSTFAGIWDTKPSKQKYPIHPIEAMFKFEVESGSGKELLQKNILKQSEYNKLQDIWYRFIPQIKELPIHLTHFSPFPWSIYFKEDNNRFYVSKITALGDILWWNEHATIAHILYPPFFEIDNNLREAFLKGYQRDLSEEIIDFFKLFYRICTINGVYMQPSYVFSKKFEESTIDDIRYLIEIL